MLANMLCFRASYNLYKNIALWKFVELPRDPSLQKETSACLLRRYHEVYSAIVASIRGDIAQVVWEVT